MSQVGKQAPYLDGIPVVASSTQRDTLFPAPDTNQRVQNQETGFIEVYDGAAWQQVISSGNGTGGGAVRVRAKGAKGNGSTDDRAAIAAADTLANGKALIFDPGTYVIGSNLTISSPCVFIPGALLSPTTGVTVNIAAAFQGERRQYFTGAGSVLLNAYSSVGEYLVPEWWGATIDDAGPANNVTAINAMMASPFGVAGGKKVIFARGTYRVSAGGLTFARPGALVVEGSTPGTPGAGTEIKLDTTSGPVLTLGDGVNQPSLTTIRDITFHANSIAVSPAALYFTFVNIFNLDNVNVTNWVGGVGIANDATKTFQEMYFRRVQVYGLAGSANGVGTCVNIAPTGNVSFLDCNLENALTGLKVRGQGFWSVFFTGGHIEQVTWAIDVDDCQLFAQGASVPEGQLWLGPGAHAGELTLGARATGALFGGVSDLGVGNRIKASGALKSSGAQRSPSLLTDGTEWLRTNNVVDDPLFRTGTTGWTTSNATIAVGEAGMPGAPMGGSLLVTGTASNGYATRTFAADGSADYLLQIAFLIHGGNNANARVEVYDEAAALIYNSGTLSYPAPATQSERVRIHRKRIPVAAAGSPRKLTVRIYSVNNGQTTICPMLLLSKSALQFVTDHTNGTASGSGTSYQVAADMASVTVSITKSGVTHPGPLLCYFNASGAVVNATFGVNGNVNDAFAGVQYLIDGVTAREYGIVVPQCPANAQTYFYAFSGSGTLTITDYCACPVYRDGAFPAIPLVDLDTTPSVAQGAYGRTTFLANNSGATAITTFDDGFEGQEIVIEFTNANTTLTNGATLKLAGAANFVSTAEDEVTLRLRGGVWREVCRSVN